jgi:Ras-related protein Rab-5C
VTSRDSFDELDTWLAEASKFGANARELPVALCGTKTDKPKRVVKEEEAQRYAQQRGLTYFETSASTGDNVDDVFSFLLDSVVARLLSDEPSGQAY